MKIDKSKLKKSLSEVPNDCKQLIEHLKSCNEDELVESLKNIKSWNFGKCELYHWIDVLDYFDSIMERCVHKENETQWTLPCNLDKNEKDKNLLINIISFTSLLIEHSFSKHVYSSMEHLTTLLASSDMQIVLAVLNLLYVFSKRSNFISRLNQERKLSLLARLNHLADSWGGKENGFGLAECCQDLDRSCYPLSATTLHFEFYSDESSLKQKENKNNIPNKSGNKYTSVLNTIHIDNVDQITDRSLAEIMEELIATYNVPKDKQMLLFTHLRLAHYFSTYRKRLQCVQARLQALSIIVYSNAMNLQENFNILYNGFIEELVEVLEIKDNKLLEIKAAAIRTLTSVIHLDHSTKLNCIIDITGASSYHGFLPCLVRNCIQALIDNDTQQYTLPFATALFSFLYHLANYENGGEALVSCGMIDSLLKVISWKGTDSEHITFVTRAVRVIDLITNLEMAAFHTHADLNVFINRLEYDVDMCRKDQPFEIEVKSKRRDSQDLILSEQLESEQQVSMEIDSETPTTSSASNKLTSEDQNNSPKIFNKELQCYPQKAAVLKSILNFLKKAIQDAGFSDSIRHLMDGSLPKSLKHIISNAEYYGASLFMLATDVVTVYVFQEPSLLSSLQENGLTDVILHALLAKDIPPTKEVLTSLPNVFSALCLNSSGLESFKSYKPFDKIFKVLISPEYLPAIKRRRSNDPMGDTPSNLGTSMDELMRHLPSLRLSAITAIINLLKELCKLGSDPDTVCSSKLPFKVTTAQPIENRTSSTSRPTNANDGNSSGDDEEEEDDIAATPTNNTATNTAGSSTIPNQEFTNPESSVSSVIEANTNTANSISLVENLNQNSNSNTNTNNIVAENASSNNQIIITSIDNNKQQVVPLVDYILHVMKFLDAILSNNNTEDHCREFVQQKGLEPLLNLHQLPNLPIDFPLSAACVSLGNVCKSIFCLSQEKEVLKQGLICLQKVLYKLKPLHTPLEPPGGSVLLEELIQSSELYQNVNNCDPLQSAVLTPLSHSLSAAHSYITMFINLSRCAQNEIKTMCISHWGSELGQAVLKELGLLYTSLVWESTILLAFCSENNSNNINSNPTKFGQSQLERLAALSKENNSSLIEETTKDLKKSSLDSVQTQTVQNPVASSSVNNQMDIDESTQFNVEESIEKTKTQVEVAQAILNNYRSKIKSNKLSPETRQIKTLLTSASRLGRALAELFNLLVKLSVNCPSRQRRNHSGVSPNQVNTMIDSVANSLTRLVCNALNGVPSYSPTPKFRLTFYICCVGFTSPLLFDDKKYPYHLMLHNFVQCGAQDAFFETFKWALTQGGKIPIEEGLEHPNLPDGVGEFLDSWLMLLEKMVNPKTILESTHVYLEKPASSKQPIFDPIKYLLQIHKKTFDCIMHLWNKKPLKVYGEHISESILVILCHLLRGEKIIRNKISKDLNENANNLKNGNLGLSNLISSQTDSTFPRNNSSSRLNSGLVRTCAVRNRNRETENSDYNRSQIQQLIEMGFDREAAVEAFMRTNTLEQAAEYLLERPNVSDWDMTENDQFLRAIEISLNENSTDNQADSSNRNVNTDPENNRNQQLEVLINSSEVPENTTSELNSNLPILSIENDQELPSTSKAIDNQTNYVEDCEPLSTELMNSLTNNLLSGCLKLLDTLPQTVHRVCDILLAVSQRNGEQWTKKMLLQLIDEIFVCINKLLECSKPLTSSDRKTLPDWAMQMNQIPEAAKAASRIHLFSLLFEEKKNECAQYVEESDLINNLIALLKAEQDILTLLNDSNLNKSKYQSSSALKILTPKWLAPVILLIDLYDKAAIASKRKAPLLELPKRQWKYFDERNGKWTPYTSINNKIIDEAYCNGENLVRFFVGRKKYCVQFPIMLQVNEESVNYRPIMFVNSNTATNSNSNNSPTTNTSNVKSDAAMEISEDNQKNNQQSCNKKFKVVKELDSQQNLSLIEACVCFLSLPVDVDALQAVMRLILRITRDYEMAWTFAKLGGIKSILKTTQKSEFLEFISISTLIIRHVFEDPYTLKQTIEKVLRSLWHSSMGNYREMHYQLRIFGPAACRNSESLSEIAKNIFRIQFNSVVTKKEDEDLRLLAPNATQILKILPPKNSNILMTARPAVKDIISDLLNALIIKSTLTDDEFFKSLNVISQNLKIKVDSMDTNEAQPSSTEQMQTENTESNNASNDMSTSKTTETTKPSVEATSNTFWRKEDLLFTQSVIMRILAELVRSYNVVAKLITEHQFTTSQSEFITEDCSAIAFILDNLLPNNQFIGDRDSPALARLLIVALASSVHCPDAQIQLISEIKAALARALSLNESNEKHLRIQALTGIINTMIDSYPPLQNTNSTASQNLQSLRNLSSGLNSIIFRKGLFIDLARVSHSLDLSSPHMAVTINTVLKPLETLSRAIHHTTNQMFINQKKSKASNNSQQLNNTLTDNNQNQSSSQPDNSNLEVSQQTNQDVAQQEENTERSNQQGPNIVEQNPNSADNCSTPINQTSEDFNLLNSLLMDVNEPFDNQASTIENVNINTDPSNSLANVSIDTVSVVEPMIDETINTLSNAEENYNSGDQHQQDVTHVININAIETETDDSEEIDEEDDDDEDADDEDDEEVVESEDISAAEDEEDEDEEDDHGDDDDDDDNDDEEIPSFAGQGQELEDLFLRYTVSDEMFWDLEESSHRLVSTDAPYRYNDYVHLLEGEQHTNGADASQPSVPPAPGTVSAVHPLLTRNSNDNIYPVGNSSQNQFGTSMLPRNFRTSRQRLHRNNTIPQNQPSGSGFNLVQSNSGGLSSQQNWHIPMNNLHPANAHHSNPPVMLQRLLGPPNRQNLLQFTSAIQPARIVFTSNDYQLFTTSNWNEFSDSTQLGPESNDGSMLSSVATAITRWTEESKVLDGDSMHDCVANLKPDIISFWEKHRDEEMNERKEKRKELIEKDRKAESMRPVSLSSNRRQTENIESTGNASTTVSDPLVELFVANSQRNQQPTATNSESVAQNELEDNVTNVQSTTSNNVLTTLNAESANNVEAEQMEITSQLNTAEVSESITTTELNSNQASQQEEVVEMNCTEIISEQEMEISNVDLNIQTENTAVAQNLNSVEVSTPEPNNIVEIPNQSTGEDFMSVLRDQIPSVSQNTEESSTTNNEQEIPEGIDPSFLAALPENIRQEVIAEQLRLQRLQQQRTNVVPANSQQPTNATSEINPEFLAALPPGIQEELIAQHNTEQRTAGNTSNPDSPVDPTDFIQALPLPLRRQVLADIDDSLLALLPNHLVNEAQVLREELEARHRHIQERFLTSHATHALSRILRSASVRGALPGNSRYTIHTVPQGSFPLPIGSVGRGASALTNNIHTVDSSNVYVNVSGSNNFRGNHNSCYLNSKLKCKQLLDNEALSCLLILLFVDEPKLNIGRLHRVIRNLCNHAPTRQWIIQSLLSIMEKAREGKFSANVSDSSMNSSNNMSNSKTKRSNTSSSINSLTSINNSQSTSWLSISMDAALGCRTDVFQIHKSNNFSKTQSYKISINPQAARIVCRHVLDTLISLAKTFPYQFLSDSVKDESKTNNQSQNFASTSSSSKEEINNTRLNKELDFWDVLVKLDSQNTSGKSNYLGKNTKSSTKNNSVNSTPSSFMSGSNSSHSSSTNSFQNNSANQSSTLTQIISLLAHPVIKKSSLLTDRLLRLLSLLAKTYQPTVTTSTNAETISINKPKASSSSSTSSSISKSETHKGGIDEEHLKLAVDVLTSKSCSEEGLEDATSLLLKLSQSDPVIRGMVLKLLLQGARELGQTVCTHIYNLSEELKKLNLNTTSTLEADGDDKINKNKRVKGVFQDRFTKTPILINGSVNTKHNPSIREVQLPSMAALTCKTSSQSFFLRILKVIIQLRESIKASAVKNNETSSVTRKPETSTEDDSKQNDNMEIDNKDNESKDNKDSLSNQLALTDLWDSLSNCLLELANAPDHHAVLVLQPAVEAFFFVHACEKEQNKKTNESSNQLLENRDSLLGGDRDTDSQPNNAFTSNTDSNNVLMNESLVGPSSILSQSNLNNSLSNDTQKFLQFAETHKVVLNQILRQSTTPLSEGPFSVLVDHTRVLDFDVKRRYFRTELDLLDEGGRREDLAVHVRREHVFEDSFRELYRRSNEEWKNRFYIVFENEEGQDAGGLLREWYTIISREIFNPMYALFCTSPGDRVTYMINSSSHCNSNHLQYFKFVGRVIAKAIYDNKLLDCYFTRSFYKHILGKSVKYTDMESEDYTFYQSLAHFLEHDLNELGLDLTFSIEVQEFGVTEVRDLKENGRNIPVTEENKHDYVRLVCQEKMTYSIKKQLSAFLEGFYEIIPKRLISIFNEQELELLISGLPNIDIDDLKANTEYHKYQSNSLQIQWFWRALRSFDQADRAKFLQFVTGTSKVPLQGFSSLEGMNGIQKFQVHREDSSTDRLPSAHTCFNQLDLPVYETYDKLKQMLLKAIHECSEGFGFV